MTSPPLTHTQLPFPIRRIICLKYFLRGSEFCKLFRSLYIALKRNISKYGPWNEGAPERTWISLTKNRSVDMRFIVSIVPFYAPRVSQLRRFSLHIDSWNKV